MFSYPPDPMEVTRTRRAADKARFEALPPDKCMACGAEGPDMRSLTISCGYALSEAVPAMIDLWEVTGPPGGWYLRVCKDCRAAFMQRLAGWFEDRKQSGGDY
jgi:hypothetical protein